MHIGIVPILQFDVLTNFVALQNIGFQDFLNCCMDSSSRCIKQVCKFPSGHPYITIGDIDALSFVMIPRFIIISI